MVFLLQQLQEKGRTCLCTLHSSTSQKPLTSSAGMASSWPSKRSTAPINYTTWLNPSTTTWKGMCSAMEISLSHSPSAAGLSKAVRLPHPFQGLLCPCLETFLRYIPGRNPPADQIKQQALQACSPEGQDKSPWHHHQRHAVRWRHCSGSSWTGREANTDGLLSPSLQRLWVDHQSEEDQRPLSEHSISASHHHRQLQARRYPLIYLSQVHHHWQPPNTRTGKASATLARLTKHVSANPELGKKGHWSPPSEVQRCVQKGHESSGNQHDNLGGPSNKSFLLEKHTSHTAAGWQA